jgi:hypothetical protein
MRDELRALADQARPGEDWPGRISRARHRRRQRWAAVSLAAAVVIAIPIVLLASTGNATKSKLTAGPTEPTTSSSPLPSSVPLDQACPSSSQTQHLDADQEPVTDAFVCTYEDKPVPGDGIWGFRVVLRVTGGLEELLRVYATPDDRSSIEGGCTADLPSPLVVFLHSTDSTHAVRSPVTPCHKPIPAARDAYEALTTVEIWSRKETHIQTQQSIDTHCVDTYKDIIEMYAEGSAPPHRSSTTPTPLEGTLTVCRYTVVKDAQGDRIGHLASAGKLDATVFDDALAKVTVDDTCSTTEHTRFALINGSRGPSVVVAIDGCAVYEDQVGYFRGTDELRRLLQ